MEKAMTIQDGTYAARPGAASVYESDKGALVMALVVKLAEGPELKSYHTLCNRDGAVNTRTVDNLKAWSGWNGVDPFWFMENDLSGMEVEVVVANEPGFADPTKLFPKVKWINPPGGGGSDIPVAADKRTVLAKYGAKFRALAGGASIPAARPAPAPAPAIAQQPPVAPSLPPVRRPVVEQPALPYRAPSSQATAWGKLCELGSRLDQQKKEDVWFSVLDTLKVDQATCADWSPVERKIEQHFAGLAPAAAPADDDDDIPSF